MWEEQKGEFKELKYLEGQRRIWVYDSGSPNEAQKIIGTLVQEGWPESHVIIFNPNPETQPCK